MKFKEKLIEPNVSQPTFDWIGRRLVVVETQAGKRKVVAMERDQGPGVRVLDGQGELFPISSQQYNLFDRGKKDDQQKG